MGSYRFILAIFVLLSHMGVGIIGMEGYNEGVVAVVSFFLISGYTIEVLHEKYYGIGGGSKPRYFYIDRILRIYPQYLFYAFITLFVVTTMKLEYSGALQSWTSHISLFNVIQCLLCLPMGYYMFNGVDSCLLLPQAWTLGLELTFYFVFPIIYKYKLYKPIIISSMLFYLLPYFGIIDTDIWGYRLLPGTLFVFLIGSLIARREENNTKFIIIVYLVIVILFVRLTTGVGDQLYTRSTLADFLIGMPIVLLLRDMKQNPFDKFCGRLSYGIYLNHFLIMFFMGQIPQNLFERILLIIISIALALVSVELIEKPAEAFRINTRNQLLKIDKEG